LMKRRVEHRDLWHGGKQFQAQLDAEEVRRIVQWREGNQVADCRYDVRIDARRRAEALAAVDHAMADGVGLHDVVSEARLAHDRQDGGKRSAMVGSGDRARERQRWRSVVPGSPMRSTPPSMIALSSAVSNSRYLREELPELITSTFMAGDNLKNGRSAAVPPSAIGPVFDEHKR